MILGFSLVPRTLRIAVIDSSTNIVRHPIRSAIASIGTFIGVALLVALMVVSASARNSVSIQFNAELATEVSFVTNGSEQTTGLVTDASAQRVGRLNGVVSAGLIDEIDGFSPIAVSRVPSNGDGLNGVEHLPFLMATPSALKTMSVVMSAGRLYDNGMVANRESVGLLGEVAAKQLGISDLSNFPAVFVGSLPITIIGIVHNVSQQSEVLDGVIIPPNLSSALSSGPSSPEVIVHTRPGAAQLVGREGLFSVSPFHPASISAIVPRSHDAS